MIWKTETANARKQRNKLVVGKEERGKRSEK
jgi:hypothetical protein